jgi:DNA polymerase III delta prime subunit
MSQQADKEKIIRRKERRLERLREKEASLGLAADPSISIEIEEIEAELEKLQTELVTLSNRSHRTRVNAQSEKARTRYLGNLEADVANRLKTSIHNARFIDISSEQSLGSTHLPWLYQADDTPLTFTSFEQAFQHFEQRILLLGAPGFGKTTTLLYIAQKLIQEAKINPDAPIPLLFNLSKFQDDSKHQDRRTIFPLKQLQQKRAKLPQGAAIEEWLLQLTAKYPGVSREVARFWLENERVALLLDGLDEVDDQQLINLVIQLNAYLYKHPDMTVVVCSRIVEYQPLKDRQETRLELNGAVTLQPLNQPQIDGYLEKAQATALRDALPNDRALYEMAQTPLTLSMMTLAYGGLAPTDIPTDLSLVERRQHLFDTYIDRMMQRKARRDRGEHFDLNPHNDVPTTQYQYSRKQVNRYLGWLAVRLSERMQTVLPLDRLYSFLDRDSASEQSKKFWTITKVTNAIVIAVSTLLISLLLMPKTLTGLFQATLISSVLVPSSLLIGFVTNRVITEAWSGRDDKPPLKKFFQDFFAPFLTSMIVGNLIAAVFGGIISSLAAILPIVVSLLALGAIVAVGATATLYILYSLSSDKIFPLSYGAVTVASALLPIASIYFNRQISSPEICIAASLVTSQWIFFSMKLHRESNEAEDITGLLKSFLIPLAMIGAIAYVVWSGITTIATLDWYEVTVILGLALGILGLIEENARTVLVVTVIAALIGGIVANAAGALVGASAALSLMGLAAGSILNVNWSLSRVIEAYIDYPAEKYIFNPLLKSVLTITGSIPHRCNKFLNYTIEALFIKQVGTEYEFVHRLLRDHFAIRELIPILGTNTELEEKIQSIQRLSFQGESAVDTLASLAQDADPRIRQAAIAGLVHL